MGNISYSFLKSENLQKEVQSIDLKLHSNKLIGIDELFLLSDSLTDIYMDISSKLGFEDDAIYSDICDRSHDLFEDIEKMKEKGQRYDLSILQQINKIRIKADELEMTFLSSSPDVILEKIEMLYQSLKRVVNKKGYNQNFLDKSIYSCLKKIQALHFRCVYPISEEMSEFSYQHTYAHYLLCLSKALEEKNYTSLDYKLSDEEKEAIGCYLGKEIFDETAVFHKARAIRSYLKDMQEIKEIAKAFFFDEAGDAIKRYRKLKRYYKEKINNNIWIIAGKTFDNILEDLKKENKEAKGLIATAMMKFISEMIN